MNAEIYELIEELSLRIARLEKKVKQLEQTNTTTE